MSSTLPELQRQQTDSSDWTTQADKEAVKHIDQVQVPATISEDDEGPNVGMAAYEASKQMGVIVCLGDPYGSADIVDP